jgi:hypothetical protein
MKMAFSVLAEVYAKDLIGEENINWRYCNERATFVHRDADACEFILHIGSGTGRGAHAAGVIREMTEYGCTPAFIKAYTDARDEGAMRVLFYV